MVVGGLNIDPHDTHAFNETVHAMINFSLLVRKACQFVNLDETLFAQLRIGLHIGDAVGIIIIIIHHLYHLYHHYQVVSLVS